MNSTEPLTADADLDAIERTLGTRTEVECPRCEGSGEGPDLSDCSLCLGNCAVAANSAEAMESLARFLLARVRSAESTLAAIHADIVLTQMTPHPDDSGAYVLGRAAERALFHGEAASRTIETAEEWAVQERETLDSPYERLDDGRGWSGRRGRPYTEEEARAVAHARGGQLAQFRRVVHRRVPRWEPAPPAPDEQP